MANGLFAGGDGTVDNPYLIEDAHDLDAIRNGLDKHYKQIKDIDMNVSPYNEGNGWSPVGVGGKYNGNGYKLKNIFTKNGSTFSLQSGGVIENVWIKDGYFESGGNNWVGAINGYSNGGTNGIIQYCLVENCVIKGENVSITDSGTGGLVARLRTGTLRHCKSMFVTIESPNNFKGNILSDIHEGKVSNVFCVAEKYVDYDRNLRGDSSESFWDSTVSSAPTNSRGRTTLQLQSTSTYNSSWTGEKLSNGNPVWILEDGEYPKLWFEEPSIKFLIKQGSNYHTLKSGFYENGKYSPLILDGGLTPNVNDFENYGFDSEGDLLDPRSEIVLSMDGDSIVGEGKTYKKPISGYGKIVGMRNLDLKI